LVLSLSVSPSDWIGFSSRLLLATLVGCMIGWNRQTRGKAAGLRTHMLVGLGAALFVLVPVLAGAASPDAVSRSIQGVATGVGFLGAGEILQQSRTGEGKAKVKGLTSAAAIWVTAALGILAAVGFWEAALVGTVLTLLILNVEAIERFIPVRSDKTD